MSGTIKIIAPSTPEVFRIVREPGLDFATIILEDGSSEEVDYVDMKEWFRMRHNGRMDDTAVEKAIDDSYNFYESEILVRNPRKIIANPHRAAPVME